jgi:hypothetical protein
MKSIICASAVAASLLAHAVAAAQPARALADWATVRRLEPGVKIVVAVRAGGRQTCQMAFADETTLVIVRPSGSGAVALVSDALRAIGPNWPAILGGRDWRVGALRVSREAVRAADGERVGDVVLIARQEVFEIRRPEPTEGRDLRLAAGIAAIAFGALSNSSDANAPHTSNLVEAVRHPAKALESEPLPRSDLTVIYRAPQDRSGLDEALWPQFKPSLPPGFLSTRK